MFSQDEGDSVMEESGIQPIIQGTFFNNNKHLP